MGPEPGVKGASAPLQSIGGYLSRQRRMRGISLDELSAVTHIPRRSLERLEAGAFDRTKDGFSRGFVRTVATAIGLDPEDAVARMLDEARPVDGPRTPLAHVVLLGVSLAVLLAGLIVVAGLRGSREEGVATAPAEASASRRRDFVRELAEEVAAGRPPRPGEALPH